MLSTLALVLAASARPTPAPPARVAPAAVVPAAVAPAADRSPYVEMGREEAVRWRPFGVEALREAQEKGRPILLDLGAMWCHYCRVMSEVTYRDPDVAAEIEENFIPIKADRDQLPQLDTRLQAALLKMREIGGWPLTAFLTEEGRMFSGGTFFTPHDQAGRPGLQRVAHRYGADYQGQKRGYHNTAEETASFLIQQNLTEDRPGPLEGVPEAVAAGIGRLFDPVSGGFGTGAKFPEYPAFGFALEYGSEHDSRLRNLALHTLDMMANGAIRDRLGGGFHRATVDRQWREPRFEKLLVVNAGVLGLYADGFRHAGVERYRKVANETLDYILRVLSDRSQGGFYNAQAADRAPGDNGSTYTWTLAEVRGRLKGDGLKVVTAYYKLADEPKVFADAPQANVFATQRTIGEAAEETKLPVARAQAALDAALETLRKARGARAEPPVDRTIYSSSNGLAVQALLKAAAVLGRDDAKEQALRTLDRFLAQGWKDDVGFVRGIRDGEAFGDGILQDQAYLALALVDAYEATGRADYLDAARRTLDVAFRRFADPGSGALFDLPVAGGPDYSMFVVPDRPVQDTMVPGENAEIALAEARIARLTGDPAPGERARAVAAAFAGSVKGYGPNGATFALAVKRLLEPPPLVLVIGGRGAEALASAAQAAKRAGVAVVHAESAEALPAALRTAEVAAALAGGTPPVALVVAHDGVRGPFADSQSLGQALTPPPPPRPAPAATPAASVPPGAGSAPAPAETPSIPEQPSEVKP